MPLTFHSSDLESSDVIALLAFHFEDMRSKSPLDACHVLPLESLREKGTSFFSARENGILMGIGALKRIGAGHGEVKSMRTAPWALGRGVGRAILRKIMSEALERGYRRLSLETGTSGPFTPALKLYESEGFVTCGPFGSYRDNPFTRFLTREL
ncbi:MAG TPA: GNAT family N-acetyltransferase [Sphingomicrobium sp.]|jgi:putative acetyltransferase|nr:GNAT family N-acetyltransferase [Sphingomicrobium sp.]